MDIGVRELRSGLKRCLDAVKAGEEVVVTEYGRPVARIVRVADQTALERLIDAGVITRPLSPPEPAATARRVRARGAVSSLVKDQRR